MEKQYGGFSKKLNTELLYDPAIPLLGIYLKKTKNANLERYMHPNVPSSIIYNSQDKEATLVPIITNKHKGTHTNTHTENIAQL